MKLFGAIDLHSDNNVLVLIDENDEVLYRKRLPNPPQRGWTPRRRATRSVNPKLLDTAWYRPVCQAQAGSFLGQENLPGAGDASFTRIAPLP